MRTRIEDSADGCTVTIRENGAVATANRPEERDARIEAELELSRWSL